jgi:integrase/recombinase XerD
MNDLAIPSNLQECCPTLAENLQRVQSILESIQSFEDIDRIFLRGQGLSHNTYRSYLAAVKQFYKFSGGLNPLQVTPAWIEMFYDHLVQKVDRNTAHLRICGLKKFFSGIHNFIPFYTDPFEMMSESLKRKLNRSHRRHRTKQALNKTELKSLLAWLREDRSIKGLENYAIILTLVTSGLRASELCQLNWDDLDEEDGHFTAYFVAKSGKAAEQEIYPTAIKAAETYFKARFQRAPKSGDYFFYTLENFHGRMPSPLKPPTLWARIHKIGKAASRQKIITRSVQFSPHLFRRTFATLYYKETRDIKATQLATRHSSVDVLMRHYVDSAQGLSEVVAKILD